MSVGRSGMEALAPNAAVARKTFRRASHVPIPVQVPPKSGDFDVFSDDVLIEILRRAPYCGDTTPAVICWRFRIAILLRQRSLTLTHVPRIRTFCFCSALTRLRVSAGASPLVLTQTHAVDLAALTALTALAIDADCTAVMPPSPDNLPSPNASAALWRVSTQPLQPASPPPGVWTKLLSSIKSPFKAVAGCAQPPPPAQLLADVTNSPTPTAPPAAVSASERPASPRRHAILADLSTVVDLSATPRLRSLVLEGWRGVHDGLLFSVVRIKPLRELSLAGTGVSSIGLGRLLPLAGSLQSLDLSGCTAVASEGLGRLAGLSSLESLRLSGCPGVTPEVLSQLVRLSKLTRLDISHCADVSDAGISHLGDMRALRRLELAGCKHITGNGVLAMTCVASQPALEQLSLGRFSAGAPALQRGSLPPGASHLARRSLGACPTLVPRLPALEHLDLSQCVLVDDVAAAAVAAVPALRWLSLTACVQLTGSAFAHIIASQPTLTYLSLSGCRKLQDYSFACFGTSHSELRQLELAGCRELSDDGLAHMARLPALEVLNLRECWQIGNAGLAHLADATMLTALNLRMCTTVTDDGVANLSGLPLRELVLDGCIRLTGDSLHHVAQARTLRTLSLAFCVSSDAGVANLATLPALQSLNLNFCHGPSIDAAWHLGIVTSLRQLSFDGCDWIQDGGVAFIAGLSRLTTLSLGHMVLNHELEDVAWLKELRQLVFENSRRVTAAGFAHLTVLTALEQLELKVCRKLKYDGMGHIAQLTTLKRLVITQGRCVTDSGLRALTRLTRLSQLTLNACSLVTDAGLKHLSRLECLRALDLSGCSHVTHKGLAPVAVLPLLQNLDLTASKVNLARLSAPLPASVQVVGGMEWP